MPAYKLNGMLIYIACHEKLLGDGFLSWLRYNNIIYLFVKNTSD